MRMSNNYLMKINFKITKTKNNFKKINNNLWMNKICSKKEMK